MKKLLLLLALVAVNAFAAGPFGSSSPVMLVDPVTLLGYAAGSPTIATASGTITTQNLVPGGAATAGSAVEITVTGASSLAVQTTGTYTGALSAQALLLDGTWITLCSSVCADTFTRATTGGATATIASGVQDVFAIKFPAGALKVRVTALAAVTGTATITLQAATSGGGVSSGGVAGDASAANQTTGNASLASIDGKTPALVSGRQPVDGSGVTQPVSLASVPSHAVTNAGTFVVQENGAALTALQIMDDWDESDRAKVNIIVGQAGITAGAGAVAANTPRVTHASDDPAVTALALINTSINTTFSVASATLANVSQSATSGTCLASDAGRKGGIFVNDVTSATLNLKFGATASATSYTFQLLPGGTLTLPTNPVYTGVIDCIWSAAGSGAARVSSY